MDRRRHDYVSSTQTALGSVLAGIFNHCSRQAAFLARVRYPPTGRNTDLRLSQRKVIFPIPFVTLAYGLSGSLASDHWPNYDRPSSCQLGTASHMESVDRTASHFTV